jgi:outer membrane protein TolC
VPINLPSALRLALLSNLDIAQAQAVVDQARAALERAQVSILPNFNLGSTYTEHEGNIQKTEGNIIKVNKDALFVGGGPSLTLQLTEAIFGPLTAQQLARASQAGLERVTSETLLAVADAYFAVLRARRRLARTDETLTYLTTERPLGEGQRFKGLLPMVEDYARVGGASLSDVERVRVEILRRQDERAGAIQEYQVAAAELARLLRLDPGLILSPTEDFRYPMALPGEAWYEQPVDNLVNYALANRPELAESQAVAQAALQGVRAAHYRPLLPTVAFNYSWGDYGGGPDLNPSIITPPKTPGGAPTVTTQPGFGPSGVFRHFAPRQDVDISLIWRLQNLGFGNRAELHEQQARYGQAQLRQLQTRDRVISQVVQAQDLVAGWRERVRITQAGLFDEKGAPNGPTFRSLRLDLERIRNQEGRPLEAIDSIRRLSDILEAYGQAITDYERARFRLLIVLGLPPRAILDPETLPGPPSCPPNDALPNP